MTEFAPPGSNPRMTPAQVKKYLHDMKKAQKKAQDKLEEAKKKGDLETDPKELEELENILDDIDIKK